MEYPKPVMSITELGTMGFSIRDMKNSETVAEEDKENSNGA